ncbi:hypothetical protein HDU76_002305 [Blyttiomyces sp. JEL0837]|nr:hypothetical protein HDU76_002305 [Blyttiomyces sp. JEL0837]
MSNLSQDDFRKLLATPRPGGQPPSTPRAKPPPKPSQQKERSSVEFAKPDVLRKKKKEWRKPDSEDQGPAFRDRAKERREGINPDYQDSEEILARLASAEVSSEAEAASKSALYEQSKYLGGDVQHTHLVKGLDFALLKKVRKEMEEKGESTEAMEMEPSEKQDTIRIRSKAAEDIYNLAVIKAKEKPPARNELFIAGRMAFLWDVDGVSTAIGSDPYVPTTVIRSKSEIKEDVKSTSSGNSEIVLLKVCQLIESARLGGRLGGDKKKGKGKERDEKVAPVVQSQKPVVIAQPPVDDDEDIFGDAGRDYSLESTERKDLKPPTSQTTTTKYFGGDDDMFADETAPNKPPVPNSGEDEEDADLMEDLEDESTRKPKQQPRSKPTTESSAVSLDVQNILQQGANMLNTLEGAGTAEKLIHTINKPTESKKPSNAFGAKSTNYGEDDEEVFYYDSEDGGDGEDLANNEQVDMGTKANKRRQMSRFDFETEEEWAAYKESQVHIPKAAFQFGVKNADGRRKIGGKGGGGGNKEAAKLNKEFQMLDKVMTEKYGESIGGSGSKGSGSKGAGGPNRAERRAAKRGEEGGESGGFNKKQRR